MTYVVWLNNKTNISDNKWEKVTGKNREDAKKRLARSGKVDTLHFSFGHVYTVKEFEKVHGKGLLG